MLILIFKMTFGQLQSFSFFLVLVLKNYIISTLKLSQQTHEAFPGY